MVINADIMVVLCTMVVSFGLMQHMLNAELHVHPRFSFYLVQETVFGYMS